MLNKKDFIDSIKCVIETEIAAGVNEVCIAPVKKAAPALSKVQAARGARQAPDKASPEGGQSLKTLKRLVMGCRNCPLSETRTNVVFGEGNPDAELMFVGEAPGRDEDAQGRPFVGRAGQLLTKIIESIGLKREDVYIANILKCRPPNNRNPLPSEIAACNKYLLSQIELIKPKVICALGKFAAQTLLDTETPISRLRGRFYDYHGVQLMPTYHPAYLLRNPGGKKEVWIDMKLVAKALGLNVAPKKRGKR